MPSGRPKGGKNKEWTALEKEAIILNCIEEGLGSSRASKKFHISSGQYYKWKRSYEEEGIKGLENKKKPGNPLAKYSKRKSLTEVEKLEYENMKLRIENELLKKGYLMKGDGILVAYKSKNK